MSSKKRSVCPITNVLDLIGDKWTLLVIRDMIIEDKKYFGEFLQSKEKIATNILTNRLQLLENSGIVYKKKDPNHKQKIIYRLTEKGIDLFPILMENARWSLKYMPVDSDDAMKAQTILDAGSRKIKSIMLALKKKHLSE